VRQLQGLQDGGRLLKLFQEVEVPLQAVLSDMAVPRAPRCMRTCWSSRGSGLQVGTAWQSKTTFCWQSGQLCLLSV